MHGYQLSCKYDNFDRLTYIWEESDEGETIPLYTPVLHVGKVIDGIMRKTHTEKFNVLSFYILVVIATCSLGKYSSSVNYIN